MCRVYILCKACKKITTLCRPNVTDAPFSGLARHRKYNHSRPSTRALSHLPISRARSGVNYDRLTYKTRSSHQGSLMKNNNLGFLPDWTSDFAYILYGIQYTPHGSAILGRRKEPTDDSEAKPKARLSGLQVLTRRGSACLLWRPAMSFMPGMPGYCEAIKPPLCRLSNDTQSYY